MKKVLMIIGISLGALLAATVVGVLIYLFLLSQPDGFALSV